MRWQRSEAGVEVGRSRNESGARRKLTRKSQLRRAALESLEPRTLLATLPAPVVSNPADISGSRGDESSPSIAVDTNNPQKLVAVWTRNDPMLAPGPTIIAEGTYSVDGGQNWTPLFLGGVLGNPNTTNPTVPFQAVTDLNVAFDRNDNVYILDAQHTTDNTAGAIVLNKFSFAGGTPTPVISNKPLYEWVPNFDQAINPTLAIDNNLASFSDTDAKGQTRTQTDPFAGDVYVAWETVLVNPAGFTTGFNPNEIKIIGSSDGGQSFSGQSVVNDNTFFGNKHNGAPHLTVSQGRAPRPAGTNGPSDPGDPGLPGGQVSVVWDDFGTGAAPANPQFDVLWANSVQGGIAQVFSSPGGPINDALAGTPNTQVATDFPINVNITNPNFTTLSDLNVSVSIRHPTLGELSLVLIPPSGSGLSPVTLFTNQQDAAGNTNNGIGISGANLGISANGTAIGTVFDDQAARDIVDINPANGGRGAAAPFIGNFRPEFGSLSQYNGLNAAALNGTWTLEVTDFRNATNENGFLVNASLNFTSGMTPKPVDSEISTTFVRGTATGTGFPVTSAATPTGIGPDISVASDNTLGAFSPYQGRLYATFVDRPNPLFVPTPPPDYTFISMAYSDDDGATWTVLQNPVNDDVATKDGFTESDPSFFALPPTGRPHFEPHVAVDNATGTVVLSWYDARNDAARARVATYVTTSIDGGQTFSPDVFVNPAQTATDAITGKTNVIGPIPDNQSAGNANRDTTFGFGTSQGLTVYDGKIHVAWSSSVPGNGPDYFDGGADGKAHLDIRTATATFAAGPRIVASTMGPIGETGDTVNPNRTADGTPLAQAFQVTFDRPIDPNSFDNSDVTVMYRDTTAANVSGGPVPVISVQPVNLGYFGPAQAQGATRFQVNFAPRSAVGTYSYTVGPNISDRIRGEKVIVNTSNTTTTTTPAVPPEVPKPVIDIANPPYVVTSKIPISGIAAGNSVAHVSVKLNLQYAFTGDLVIQLIAPDNSVVTLSNEEPAFGVGDGDHSSGFIDTVFDDGGTPISLGFPPYTGTFAPETPLSDLLGKNPNGTWTLKITDNFPATDVEDGKLNSWSLVLTTGKVTFTTLVQPGNLMDQNANGITGQTTADVYAAPTPIGGVPYNAPYNQDTLPLIVPGPHIASTHVAGSPVTDDNLVLNKTASSIDVTFDRAMAVQSFTPADVLRIMGPSGPISGPFTVAAAYNSTDVNKSFPQSGQTTVDSILDLSGAINAGFTISHLAVQLNISHAKDSDITATLIAPDGTRIQLFSGVGGTSGQNFLDTVLDDSAATPITQGTAPFNSSFQPMPSGNGLTLSALNGKPLQGIWTLELSDSAGDGIVGTLNSWSLTANSSTPAYAPTFRVGFPQQQLSGTYVVSLASSIQSKNGDALDTNLNAGLDLLKGTASSGAPTVPITYNSSNVPATIVPGRIDSTLSVPDSFVLQSLTLTLNITYPNDPDLEATLIAPDGTRVKLFTNIGATGTHANFSNTVFDDKAATPIQNGGPPFFGSFNPQEPLSQLAGKNATGTWTLEIKDDSAPSGLAQLTSWSLTFQKPVPSSGLGELVADQATATFRIFTMDPTNPLSSNTWTAVGPAAIDSSGGSNGESAVGGSSGRIGGIAVDPSDPSGNTVYIGGASGGIWKTTNFLQPGGPTYIPVTDFGPTFAINIGSIAVFGRNSDPNQSIVFGATGEGDTGSPGVGFIRSMDGGATWTLLDSTNNNLPFAQRDHLFAKNGGSTSFKILVDPKPAPDGNAIVYAALSGGNGGVWRSLDTGQTWQLMRAGQATDIVLDPNSGTGAPGGNLQIIYAGFRGEGVFSSPNRGQVWNQMNGGVGDPLIQDGEVFPPIPIPVTPPSATPNGAKGRIVLAKPALTGNPVEDVQYQGWLYAAVATPDGHLDGLYLTKDFGQNWTKVRIATLPASNSGGSSFIRAVPTNDPSAANPDYDVLGFKAAQGNYDISLAVDPTNPSIAYIGGSSDFQPTGLIRVDTSNLADPHAEVAYSNTSPDNGSLTINSTGSVSVKRNMSPPPTPYFNLLRNPAAPFLSGATQYVFNTARFNNPGTGSTWIPFDMGGTDQHRFVTEVDPLTGHARLIIGDDQGVWTEVDNKGTFSPGIGTAPFADGSRSGNLQITQFYYGAAQPSNLAAQIAGALFYGSAQDNGGPFSDPNVLSNGNITWTGPGGDAAGVATNQTSTPSFPGGDGTLYQYWWPCCGGNGTDFFQVNGVGRTFGLLQQSNPGPTPDPQWPFGGGVNFAINPLNGDQAIISSTAGRIFATENRGLFWSVIGDPAALDGSQSFALAYGAPDPNGPGGIGNLDNFLYVGTNAGHIFITQTGGGGAGNQWTDISAGLADNSPVQAIVTNPTRGSHEAYAVTSDGVYHILDSTAPGATWQNITANIFKLTHNVFGDPNFVDTQARYLTSIVVDWRYVIPTDFNNPNSPTHPMLYVGGEGGVYRSIDNGVSWVFFPDSTLNGTPTPPGQGGGLPVAHVTDLDLSLGAIDPTNGRPIVTTASPNVLLASTYGRGSFAIRLAPVVFGNTLHLDTTLPPPGGSDSGPSNSDRYTNITSPYIDGLSEQTAFGNVVTINLIDETDPTNPVVIGTGTTDSTGHFSVQVAPGYFKTDGSTDGLKTIGVQGVDQAGTKGNIATFQFTLDTTPPAAPGAPVLEAASDSGLSNSDNITNVTSPTFDITTVEPGTTTVYLLRDGTVVASASAAQPFVAIQDQEPSPVPDGVHIYTAKQIDLAGNAGPVGGSLSVTIITVPPPAPAVPVLDPNDDSGTKGDNITNVTQPHLDGSAQPNGLIQLIDAAGNVIGQASIASNGTYTVQPSAPLANGTYALRVQDEDIAGNISDPSPALTLTILNQSPAKPTIMLVPSDDSSHGQDITNVKQPRVEGVATPGLTVVLINSSNAVVAGPGIVAPDGSYLLQFPTPLADGTYTVRAQVSDVAGNTATSDPLTFQILTKAPATKPTLLLSTADDTGTKGDNVTTVRRPHFIGTAAPNAFVDVLDSNGTVQATTVAKTDGTFTVQLPNDLNNGQITLQSRIRDIAGNEGTPSAPLSVTITTAAADYDSDAKGDLAVFRPTNAQWFIFQSSAGPKAQQFGAVGDIPLQGDFDGDGKTDLISFRPSTATWYVLRSALGPQATQFGWPGVDLPAPGDYDGDGRTDLAVYRPTTGQWFILQSSLGPEALQLSGVTPQPGDIPVPGKWDGGTKTEIAIFRPSTDTWYIQTASGLKTQQFGWPGVDLPVPGNYDGTGQTEIAVYRPTTAQWFIIGPSGPRGQQFGAPGDVPVPADYDGDGKTDLAVFRESTATWYLNQSTAGLRAQQFGWPGVDIPVNAPYQFLVPGSSIRAFGMVAGQTSDSSPVLNFGRQAATLASSSSSSLGGSARSAFNPIAIAPPTSASTTVPVLGTGAVTKAHGRAAAVHHHVVRHVSTTGRAHTTALDHALNELEPFGTRRRNG
jgi:subtilisin-like proprotein convertase family protein